MSDQTADPTTGADKDFLETAVKAIVDNPDDVIVERSVDDLGVLLKLRVNEADMSKIVGKEGRTAKALRTLLRLVGSKFDERVNLKILEPDGSERRVEKTETPRTAVAPNKEEKKAAAPAKTEDKAETPEAPKEGEDAAGAFENVI
ncbi:MAG: KH domain-containing protein [Candidatus Peribacteraceae bacterium]|nr:KH domain-containing protein [Candidatus Peribacteraceae bacterium]